MTRSTENAKVKASQKLEPKLNKEKIVANGTSYAARDGKISINRTETGVWTFSSNDSTAIASLLVASAPFLSTQTSLRKTTFVVLPRLKPYQLKNNKVVNST